MPPRMSRDLPESNSRLDRKREMQDAITTDADKSDGGDRDLLHGEGGSIGIPDAPRDISKDD